MSRGVSCPVVIAFRVTEAEAVTIDEAVSEHYETKGYGRYSKGMRASWLRRLVLAAIAGEDLPVYRRDPPVNSDRCKRGSSAVNKRRRGER